MWQAFVVAILLAALGAVTYENTTNARGVYEDAYQADTALNFSVYAARAQAAYTTNPSYSGVVPQAAMNLPAWYRPAPGIVAFANAGHLFVYQPQANAIVGGRVLKQIASGGKVIVGMALGGTIYSPANVALMVAPVGVPNFAVVQVVM